MTKVAILQEPTNDGGLAYRAISGTKQSVGKTAGEALDALTAELPSEETGTLVVIQHGRPDRFFNAEQQSRLRELMKRWNDRRNAGSRLSSADQAELDTLIAAELRGAEARAAALLAAVEE